jgi:hypothetical protein
MLIASIAAAGCVLASATGTMKACEWFKSAGLRGECPRCRTRAASFYHERAGGFHLVLVNLRSNSWRALASLIVGHFRKAFRACRS